MLAAVFRSADERLADGEMTHPRFAAKATLTLRLESDGQKRFTTDAWLTADWFDSTRALLAALDADPGIRARAPGSGSQRVDVVFAADRVHWADGTDLYEAVERIAHLAGMRARLLFLSGQNYASTRARLRSEQPTHLVFIGSNGIDEVRQEFEVRNRGAAHILEQNNPTDLVGALYEKIPRIGGIAANLMLYSVPPSAPDRLPDMPSIDAIDCKHVNNRVYVLDSIENVWWTRDDAHHARVQFKTYTLQNDTLHWRADHGADHVVAEGKHKGSGTMTVSLKAATSCGNPRRHLFS
ncbi:hypothetical protein H489_0106835 [Curtobacterium flaccumfaciens UCD-AKU]|nr:hypothetical protein H489_0106835 [Curtobacterium flaccumfaciens UCD-AKU]